MATERGTKERWQHDKPQVRSIEMGSGKATTEVIAVHNPHVIDMLADAGVLTQQQADAALWLAELRQAAGMDGRVVSSCNPLGAGGEQSDSQRPRLGVVALPHFSGSYTRQYKIRGAKPRDE